MRRALSIGVLIGVIVLLQTHGIEFWMSKVGVTGILWSLLLEAAALWLWYQPGTGRRVLGLIASAMLLAGPLHQVAIPVLQAMEDAKHAESMRVTQISIIHDEISNLETSLGTFRKNSESRSGWLNAIQQTEQRLSSARQELRELLAAPKQSALDWGQQGVVLMQGAALVLFQLTAVLIIMSLSSVSRNSGLRKQQEPEVTPVGTESETLETKPETYGNPDVVQLSERLEEHLARRKLTAKEFSTRHKLNPRDVSLLRNHSRRAAAGKQVAPPGAVRRVAEILSDK